MILAKQGFVPFLFAAAFACALAVPFSAKASDGTPPNPPAITVNGIPLPPVSPLESSLVATSSSMWDVLLTFDEDISNLPTIKDGTPSFGFANGTTQSPDDCSDADLKTFCFSYMPPAGIEAAVFWFFQVSEAQDLSGEPMGEATYRFIVDTAGPVLAFAAVTDGVSLPTISGDSSFGSAVIDITLQGAASRTYQTTASGGFWSYTLQPGDELPQGPYLVTAVGTDQYNNVGEPITTSITAPEAPPTGDITPPVLSEVAAIGGTWDTTPSYTFMSNEAGTIIYSGTCWSVDIIAVEGMNTVTLSELPLGTYSDCALTVTDTAGNTSAPLFLTPFSILPPIVLTITGGPAEGSFTNSTSANFTFTSTSPTFCSLDGAALVACTGSYSVSDLVSGTHLFTVTAVDSGNNSTSATRTWHVDNAAPILAEVAIETSTSDTTPTYVFSSSKAGTIFYGGACSSATSAATAGDNTIVFSPLSVGTYSNCTIIVVDSLGNMSEPLQVSTFTITPVAPPPQGPTSKDQCKANGWRTFVNPSFKNQGDCVSYVNHLNKGR